MMSVTTTGQNSGKNWRIFSIWLAAFVYSLIKKCQRPSQIRSSDIMAPSVATTVSRIGKVAHKFEYSCHRRPSRWHCYTNSSVSTTFLKKSLHFVGNITRLIRFLLEKRRACWTAIKIRLPRTAPEIRGRCSQVSRWMGGLLSPIVTGMDGAIH